MIIFVSAMVDSASYKTTLEQKVGHLLRPDGIRQPLIIVTISWFQITKAGGMLGCHLLPNSI